MLKKSKRSEELRILLKTINTISVPMLQTNLELTYSEARELVRTAVAWGWVSGEPDGICYTVYPNNLEERELSIAKLSKLFGKLTSDCYRAITCLCDNGPCGFSDLVVSVQGAGDTIEALKILLSEKVIRKTNGMYFFTISTHSARTMEALKCLQAERSTRTRKAADKSPDELKKEIEELYANIISKYNSYGEENSDENAIGDSEDNDDDGDE